MQFLKGINLRQREKEEVSATTSEKGLNNFYDPFWPFLIALTTERKNIRPKTDRLAMLRSLLNFFCRDHGLSGGGFA